MTVDTLATTETQEKGEGSRTRFPQVRLRREDLQDLDSLKASLGATSNAQAVRSLIKSYRALQGGRFSVATSEIFRDSRPVVISGPSGSGKTSTTKQLLSQVSGPYLVIDPSDEWGELEPLDYSKVPALNWDALAKWHVQLSPDVVVSKTEANLVFRSVGLASHRGSLRSWIVVVEEAHRFARDRELVTLVLEARKFTKKLLVLTADPSPWENLAPIYTPALR